MSVLQIPAKMEAHARTELMLTHVSVKMATPERHVEQVSPLYTHEVLN